MRAVGFFRPPPEPDAAEPTAVAAPDSRTPVSESSLDAIERYCREDFHQLVRVMGVSSTDAAAAGRDVPLVEGSYTDLAASFSAAGSLPALVVIPDSTHLADDLPALVERLIELDGVGGDVRCADPDLPDPLQNALAHLSMRGRATERLKRVREAIGAKAARGEVLGRIPYGYRAGLDGRLIPVPAEAEAVRRIFDWYSGPPADAESQGDESPPGGPGLRTIATRLNDQGVRTRPGNPWTAVGVAAVLRNRAYVGTYTRLGMRIVASHPALVDRVVFNRAQDVLRLRQPGRRVARPERYLLGGLLRCAVCGRGVFGLTRRRRWRRKDGTEMNRAYRYYECASHAPRRRVAGWKEEHPSWRAELVEAAVRAEVEAWSRSVREDARMVVVGGPSASRRRRSAERTFMRSLRDVAAGSGTLQDLARPLTELRQAQADAEEGAGRSVGVWLLVEDALGEDAGAAGAALHALISRVTVGIDRVDVTMLPFES